MRPRGTKLAALIVAIGSATGPNPAVAYEPCEVVKLLAADGGNLDKFGCAVALSGDRALVGADGDAGLRGSAYVFERIDAQWRQVAKLEPGDPEDVRQFGSAVALDGDTALIGAHYGSTHGRQAGAVYVFELRDGAWSEVANLCDTDEDTSDFGWAVSLDGDTAVIGAWAVAAYVLQKIDGVWQQTARLTPSDEPIGAHFGWSVGLSGDVAFVGAPWDYYNRGAVYVYERTDGVWTEVAKLIASEGGLYEYFGSSVAVSGDTAFVGTPRDYNGRGSAYIFQRMGGVWRERAKVVGSDAGSGAEFGNAVAVRGDMALIGAWNRYDEHGPGTGAAYRFRRVYGNWYPSGRLTAGDASQFARFGYSVALSDTMGLVGAKGDGELDTNAGAAYVFALDGEDCNVNGVYDACDIGSGASADCNLNGVPDECDLADGTSEDTNGNGVPDECDCSGDLDGDFDTDQADLGVLLASWHIDAGGDLDNDGDTDQSDLGILLADWGCVP